MHEVVRKISTMCNAKTRKHRGLDVRAVKNRRLEELDLESLFTGCQTPVIFATRKAEQMPGVLVVELMEESDLVVFVVWLAQGSKGSDAKLLV